MKCSVTVSSLLLAISVVSTAPQGSDGGQQLAQYQSVVCRTPIVTCYLPAPQPVNSPCFCPNPGNPQSPPVQGIVTFSDGFVPVEDIPAMISDADLGLVPLRVSSGTDIMLPTKLLEYVAMGIPSIVPRTGTICRYFDSEMVQFFEAENPESLSLAILSMYRDEGRRKQLALQATARFGEKFSWAEQEKRYVELVADLLRATA